MKGTVERECFHVQVYPGRTALVVSLENITENVYLGNQRSMTITNCLFRLGGAAVLLSNKARHWWSARCPPFTQGDDKMMSAPPNTLSAQADFWHLSMHAQL
jgi:hypothetical protein